MSWICVRCKTRFEEPRTRCPHDKRRVVEDLSGQEVGGRYSLRELLGVGGMDSSVWLAWQISTHRPVAIKLLPPVTGDAAERFARGARIASNLNHPNITTVHDYGQTEDGGFYLVMELLEGQDLHKVIRQAPLPIERAINITVQILAALSCAHKKRVVHRDIKPGNIFLVPAGEGGELVKVLDFGIARFVQGAEGEPVDAITEITTTRQICGTPQYMAPEQVAFGHVDGRTDLYAVGVVLYRMLTGRLPFESKDHRALFRAHLHQAPPSFEEARPDVQIPEELERLVMRSLAKTPEARFASAAEMRVALKQVRHRMGFRSPDAEESSTSMSGAHSWASAVTETVDAPKGNGRLLGLVLLALIAGAVAVLVFTRMSGETRLQPGLQVDAGRSTTRVVDAAAAPPTAVDAAIPVDAEPTSPIDAAAPAQAQLEVRSTPSGAQVRIDGRLLGTTPLQELLPAGTYELTVVKDGYRPNTQQVELGAADELVSRLVILRRPGTRGRRRWPGRKPKGRAAAPKGAVKAVKSGPVTPAGKVKVHVLDEETSREFGIKPSGGRKPVKKPSIELLD